MIPVTLHATTDTTVVGLRLECPHTGQVLTVALPLDQQRELLASLTGSVARGESVMADPYAPAVARLADWKARRAEPVVLHLTQGHACLVDAGRFDEVSAYTWHLTTHGYVARKYKVEGVMRQEYLHRRLCGSPSEAVIDHIDGNKLNNVISNLRVCTRRENNANTGNRTGKYKGVHLKSGSDRWVAQIKENGRKVHLGTFASEVEAAQVYDHAARRVHGEFARLNFPTPVPCTCEIARAEPLIGRAHGETEILRLLAEDRLTLERP